MPEIGVLHGQYQKWIYKCPFRLNEGEFQRASFVSKNLKAQRSRRKGSKWKRLWKMEERRREWEIRSGGKERQGDRGDRKERKQNWGGSKLMRKGRRYRGGSRRDKGRVANTSLGSPCRPRFSFRAWFKGFGGRALAKTNTFSTHSWSSHFYY